MERENNQNVNPLLMFMCSLLPGCAHMYLGLIKRGVQLLLSFLLLIGFATTVYGLEFLIIPIIVVLFVYSFFDGYSIFRNIKDGKTVKDESFIEGLDSLKQLISNAYWIGFALLVFSIIIVLNRITDMDVFQPIGYYYNYYVEDFIPAFIMLALGIFLMVKGNAQRKAKKAQKNQIEE
ncbi:MAG: hypothetical protein AB1Z23_00135 [Eubacteriales bacterium]